MLKLYILSVIIYYIINIIYTIVFKMDLKDRGLRLKKRGIFEVFRGKTIVFIISIIPIINIIMALLIITDALNVYEKVIDEKTEKIEEVEKI